MMALRVFAFVVGLVAAASTFSSAVRTVVVPRAQALFLQRVAFTCMRGLFTPALNRATRWEDRHRVLSYYAPFSLVLLPIAWIGLITMAFAPMYWAIGTDSWRDAFLISGSSVTTLGFASTGGDWPGTILSVSEAVVGLILVALLISYLPTMYSLFSRREQTVSYMAVRAGTPPSGVGLLERLYRIGDSSDLVEIWIHFELWFNELAETHTSFTALPLFRSPNPARSWITTGGAVLDAAALRLSVLDEPSDPRCALCLRAGYSALRDIASAYRIEVPQDPQPNDPISVAREEFDTAVARLESDGLAVVADREQAWRDFQGWRVNYDVPLLILSALVSAPYAPWSSDRSLRTQRPTTRSLVLPLRRRSVG
ncbi:MAG: hypothetical protein GY724_03790 [Actinomycetia bacterium]|nr:hypothetical protein [Actinomycetes bacterium]MCP4227554.1 hypothetical protein [Actinomycetes bacterium]MCP5034423.1 hypothetical protein [Actinomycetes bacterium]